MGNGCVAGRQDETDNNGENRECDSVPENKAAPLEDDAEILDYSIHGGSLENRGAKSIDSGQPPNRTHATKARKTRNGFPET